jgi:hypothetical protein
MGLALLLLLCERWRDAVQALFNASEALSKAAL